MTESPTKRPVRDETTNMFGVRIRDPLDRATKPSWLEQRQGPGAPAQYFLEKPELVVGRSSEAQLTIESALISRRHLLIQKNGPEVTCTDLDSSNGVYLNGVKIHSALLHEGDTLQIGDVVFLFHEGK
ncbi:MAG: FHA domain-containing protein [Polyangiaceae bacterium]|nr:FHA domain-containing protein [Polyangiaceae bacterium]